MIPLNFPEDQNNGFQNSLKILKNVREKYSLLMNLYYIINLKIIVCLSSTLWKNHFPLNFQDVIMAMCDHDKISCHIID